MTGQRQSQRETANDSWPDQRFGKEGVKRLIRLDINGCTKQGEKHSAETSRQKKKTSTADAQLVCSPLSHHSVYLNLNGI